MRSDMQLLTSNKLYIAPGMDCSWISVKANVVDGFDVFFVRRKARFSCFSRVEPSVKHGAPQVQIFLWSSWPIHAKPKPLWCVVCCKTVSNANLKSPFFFFLRQSHNDGQNRSFVLTCSYRLLTSCILRWVRQIEICNGKFKYVTANSNL